MNDSGRPESPTARNEAIRDDSHLHAAIDDLANQLCVAVDGDFDFAVRSRIEHETIEKLAMLINFVLDTARRGMSALRDHNAALAEIDRAKTVFFSNASHELRTPLTLILGPLEDALSSPEGTLPPEAVEASYRNAVRLHRLVNSLLDFSRIEAGRLPATYRPTDLAQMTVEVASVFQAAFETAGLSFTVDCPTLPRPVYVDPDLWEKVVLNLLSNALKFTFEGGVVVSLRTTGDQAELEIRDSGIGIPEAELPRLFERFHRIEGTRSRTHEGFGIGLAMIHDLVRLHGGSIAVTSAPGRGSAFRVSIPFGSEHLPSAHIRSEVAGRADGATTRAFLDEAAGWPSAVGTRPRPPAPPPKSAVAEAERRDPTTRVLLADDNPDMRTYLSRLLSQHWSVESVEDGAAALEAALRNPPAIVITDVMMPHLDGPQLLRALRADPRTESTPVLFLSARAGEEALVEGLDAGADDYLVKPFAARELVARVRTHIELGRLRSDTAAIHRVSALLNTQLDLEHVVQTLTDEATALCGAQFGAFFYNMIDEAGESYVLYTLAGAPREAFEGFPLPRNTDIFASTFRGEGITRLDDVTRDPRYGNNAPYFGMPEGHLPVRSYLAVPVVARSGEVLGGLFFGHGEPGMFSAQSERLLGAVASHAAVAVENAHLYERAQNARAEAEEASRAKDGFLAMLGHELRNPLAPIVTALQVMELRGDPSTSRERAVIKRQLDHLVRLVDDLLDVSRVTRGKLDLKREPLEMSQVVAKAIELSSPLLEQRRQRLTVSVAPTGLPIDGDLVRLAQVVSNLLTNAAKYTEPEGTITLSADREGSEVVLRVRDTGVGISAELLPRVFDLFMQAPQSLARSQGGLGLGLAIAESIARQHGGSVEAHSDGEGEGSEFVVRLPLERPRAGASTARGAATPNAGAIPSTKRRVLVIDDNRDAAEALAVVLEAEGHRVRIALDGPSALEAATEEPPEVALVDIGLPVMDGYEVARRLRDLPGLSSLRLVAITGYGLEADRDRSLVAGFEDHLVKPVDVRDLLALVGGPGGEPPAPS